MQRMMRDRRTRADVGQRMARNKETEVTVVKASWRTFCKPDSLALPIDAMLRDVNTAITEAYLLANMHVLRMCELRKPVPFWISLSSMGACLQ